MSLLDRVAKLESFEPERQVKFILCAASTGGECQEPGDYHFTIDIRRASGGDEDDE